MVRFFGALTFLFCAVAMGADQQTSSPTPAGSPLAAGSPASSARFESLRRSFEQLSPDQQQKVIQNLHPGQSPANSPALPVAAATPSGSAAASARFEAFKKSFELLPTDQQQKFMLNLHRWQDLSPEERDLLRQRERIRRQKQESSINEAYQKSGLQLNEEQRTQFRKRYLQERQHLEEQLLRETQEKRQVGNLAIIEQLKKEFPAPKPTPH